VYRRSPLLVLDRR
jgi:hypothetical protein